MVKVKFLAIDSRILPEMSAKVAFLSREVSGDEEKPRLAVSRKALKVRNGNATAFLVKGSRVDEVKVTTGPQLGDMVEIADGLKAGEKVVLNPPSNLKDGSKIKLAQQ
jgi:multidrug efflux pump subunit AcrA (membrane-fusion protein)